MNWRVAAAFAGGIGAFGAAVGLGAIAIVSLTPRETTLAGPRDVLLIEKPETPMTLGPALPADPVVEPPPPPLPKRERLAPPIAVPPRLQDTAEPVVPPPAAAPRRPVQQEMSALPSAPLPPSSPPAIARAPTLRPAQDPRYEGVLTPFEIRRLKTSLRLTAEQGVHWPPIEALLQEIGTRQMALVKSGQKAADAVDGGMSMRIYWAARPLISSLREDQKVQIRLRARSMGFESIASLI